MMGKVCSKCGVELFINRKKIIFDEVIETIKNKQKYRKK